MPSPPRRKRSALAAAPLALPFGGSTSASGSRPRSAPTTQGLASEPHAPAPGVRAAPRWRAPRAWRTLLAPREPRAVLAALVPDDPLELRALIAERSEARALVVDAATCFVRVAALVAATLRPRAASHAYAGLRVGPAWLAAIVDDALSDVLAERHAPEPIAALDGARRHAVGRCPAELAVARAFAHRARAERNAAYAVLLERRELESVARAGGLDVGTLARRVRAAALALGRALAAAPPCACSAAPTPRVDERERRLWDGLEREVEASVLGALALLRVAHATRRGPHAGVDLARVEAQLARMDLARAAGAVRVLLSCALERALPADSHLSFATPREHATEATWTLFELAPALGEAAPVVEPFAPPQAAAARLVAALASLAERGAGVAAHEVALWRARVAHAAGEPRALAVAAAELARVEGEGPGRSQAFAILAGRDAVAALLDAGAAEEARALAEELGLGVALRSLRAGAGAAATGKAETVRARDPARAEAFGASALLVARVTPAGDVELLHRDARGDAGDPPVALSERAPLGDVQRLCWSTASAVVRALPSDRRAAGESASLHDERACRVAVAPVLDSRGEVAGWVQLEWRHDFALDARALAALAEAWRPRVLEAPSVRSVERAEGNPDREGSVVEAARALVADLGFGTAQRRWTLFAATSSAAGLALERVASGGAAALTRRCASLALGLERALRSGGVVDVGQQPARTALHADTASGVALACESALGGRYVLSVESPRRADVTLADGLRWRDRLAAASLALDLAGRSRDDRARGGDGFVWPADEPEFARFARRVQGFATARAPLALVGPTGSGRRTLARWVALEAARAAADGAAPPRALEVGLERLAHGAQLAWLERAQRDAAARDRAAPCALLSAAPRSLAEQGVLAPEVAARLASHALHLPALSEARQRVPALARHLLARATARAGAAPLGLDDAAVALLWRGAWPCNVLDLASVMERLVAEAEAPARGRGATDRAGRVVGAAAVEAALVGVGLAPVARLPSRAPQVTDLAAALWVTRTGGGRTNKVRAAAWLGWDTETLGHRLADLGLGDLGAAARQLGGGVS